MNHKINVWATLECIPYTVKKLCEVSTRKYKKNRTINDPQLVLSKLLLSLVVFFQNGRKCSPDRS